MVNLKETPEKSSSITLDRLPQTIIQIIKSEKFTGFVVVGCQRNWFKALGHTGDTSYVYGRVREDHARQCGTDHQLLWDNFDILEEHRKNPVQGSLQTTELMRGKILMAKLS